MVRLHALLSLLLSVVCSGLAPQATAAEVAATATENFPAYVARNGHRRPLVAVVGLNAGTELTDLVIPYAVLQRSGVVDTIAVATSPGPMTMRPALHLQPDTDVRGFDARFPEGADIVVVPAVVHRDDAVLLEWIRAQYGKGAMLVSICDGAMVLAESGLLAGHRATAHWATEGHRRKHYPATTWVANTRYVVDGRIASSAGISAAIPTSLALLESIAGREKARQVGAEFGVGAWTTAHDSDAFHPHLGNLTALAKVNATNKWFHSREHLAIALQSGMDDVSLALSADAYSRTGRSVAYGVAGDTPVRSRAGLAWLPDSTDDGDAKHPIEVVQPVLQAPLFDRVLAAVARRYGRLTARGVAIDFEYPWSPTRR